MTSNQVIPKAVWKIPFQGCRWSRGVKVCVWCVTVEDWCGTLWSVIIPLWSETVVWDRCVDMETQSVVHFTLSKGEINCTQM